MISEDGYVFQEDDDEPECPDDLESRMVILRDIMCSYDLSFIMDIRDPMFMSKLEEAVSMLGMGMAIRTEEAHSIGEGLFESVCTMEFAYGQESMGYRHKAVSADPFVSVLMSARGVMSDASLMRNIDPGDGGCITEVVSQRPG